MKSTIWLLRRLPTTDKNNDLMLADYAPEGEQLAVDEQSYVGARAFCVQLAMALTAHIPVSNRRRIAG
jgi:hypothetical protein